MTPYGATKAAAEMLMYAYTYSYDVRCTYLRLTNVYHNLLRRWAET